MSSVTGVTLTCAKCGRSEFFAGDLKESIEAASQSTNWRHDQRGFLICVACPEVVPIAEAAE